MKNVESNKSDVCLIAKRFGWKEIAFQENIGMISFKKETARVNIYLTKMTIVTIIDHPTKGRNQLIRKGVYSLKEIESIFSNPRIHTGKGYYGGGQKQKTLITQAPPSPVQVKDLVEAYDAVQNEKTFKKKTKRFKFRIFNYLFRIKIKKL